MASGDMKHLLFLQSVADLDVRELRRKEETYQGSWKQRGGIGAFMMCARKWDRLESILQRIESYKYDIFVGIQNDPYGKDGSALAEIRDLRRYLLLIEAEMAARGTVDGHVPIVTMNEWGERGEVGHRCDPGVPGTPEDGGHHSRQTITEVMMRAGPPIRGEVVYHQRLWDGLPTVDEKYRKYYKQLPPGSDGLYIIDRPNVPEELWEHLPRLPIEQNHKEWSELLTEYRHLYTWHDQSNKYIMDGSYQKHWGRQP